MADEGAIRTSDGRSLAYEQYGDHDGPPLLWFHGAPGGRLEFENAYGAQALAGAGVRVIAIDRPGFGRSDLQPGRSYDDWPADVALLADQLELPRFAVLGYSAGAPYVIACAKAIPERLTRAGIVSGVGPAETPRFRQGMGRTDRILTRLSRLSPPLARLAIRQAASTARRKPEKFSAEFDKELSPPDREIHARADLRDALPGIFLEATRQGPAGFVEDFKVWATPWGAALEQVDFPVALWHGDLDLLIPLHHAEYLAGRLPNAELTTLTGSGHLHPAERWQEIMRTLARSEDPSFSR